MSRARDLSRLVSDGADIIPFDRDIDYAAGTIGAILRDQEGGNGYVVPSLAGASDAGPLIQAAINLVPPGSKIIIPPGTYTMLSTVSTDKELHIDATGATFNVGANVVPFQFYAPPAQVVALTANYAPGAASVSVAALSSAPREGELFKIVSNALDTANRDMGSSANKYRQAEWLRAAPDGTTTSIALKSPLRFSRGVDPISAVGEEAVIDAYTTAMNARVLRLSGKTMSWKGGAIRFEDGHDADSWNSAAMIVCGYTSPAIVGLNISKGYYHGITLFGNIFATVRGCRITNLPGDSSSSALGYAVADASYATEVTGCTFIDVRDGYTTSNAVLSTNSTNYMAILGAGRTVGGWVHHCRLLGRNLGMSTHHCADDMRFDHLYIEGAADYAISLRGRNNRATNIVARNCGKGVQVFTEGNSSSPDSDNFVNDKVSGCSTAVLSDLDIECATQAIDTTGAAHVELAGNNRFNTLGHECLFNSNSRLVVTGRVKHTMGTLDGSRAIIDQAAKEIIRVNRFVDGSTISFAGIVPSIIFAPGSSWHSDLRNATGANLRTMRCQDDQCAIVIDGDLQFELANGFVELFGPLGQWSGKGRVQWSREGAADSTVALNIGTKNFDADALDGSAAWFGAAKRPPREVYRNGNVNVTHAGTGAENASVFTPPQIGVASINEAGHYQRHEMLFRKSGSTGTATITGRMAGNFNWSREMAVSDLVLCVTMEVWTRGANSQFVRITSATNDASNAVTAQQQNTDARTFDLTVGQLNRIGINAAVGDTITLETYAIYADKGGFGV